MVNYAGLTAFRRIKEQQLANRARVGIPGNNLRRTSSDSALYSDSFTSLNNYDDDDLENSIPYNTSFSNPSSPIANGRQTFDDHYSPSPDSSEEEPLVSNNNNSPIPYHQSTSDSTSSKEPKTDVGLGLLNSLLVDDDAFTRTMAPFSHQRGIVFGFQVLKLASKTPTRVSPQAIKDLSHPIHRISREIGSGGEMVTRVRKDWPCIFAPVMEPASPPPIRYSKLVAKLDSVQSSDCRSHAVVNPAGTAAFFRPVTFCSVHKNAGYLRLEDVERSENYSRDDANSPSAIVTHRFNNCILKFPPPEKLIVFKKDKDMMNPDEAHQQGHNSPNPDLPKPTANLPEQAPKKKDDRNRAGSSSTPTYPKQYCLECGICIDDRDWYFYRSRVFCSEECRYANTLDAVLLRNLGGYEYDGNPRNPGNGGNRTTANSGNARAIIIGGGDSRGPNNNASAGGTVRGGTGYNYRDSNNRGNARGIVIGDGSSRGPNNVVTNARVTVTAAGHGGNPRGFNNDGSVRGPNYGVTARGIAIVSDDNASGRADYQNQNRNQDRRETEPSSSSSSSKNDKGKGVLYIG